MQQWTNVFRSLPSTEEQLPLQPDQRHFGGGSLPSPWLQKCAPTWENELWDCVFPSRRSGPVRHSRCTLCRCSHHRQETRSMYCPASIYLFGVMLNFGPACLMDETLPCFFSSSPSTPRCDMKAEDINLIWTCHFEHFNPTLLVIIWPCHVTNKLHLLSHQKKKKKSQ